VERFVQFARVRLELQRREVAALGDLPRTDLWYERDLGDVVAQQAAVDRIIEALELPRATVSTPLRPTARGDLHEVIANYAELTAAIRDASLPGGLADSDAGGGS
jgi:hypothetical protein